MNCAPFLLQRAEEAEKESKLSADLDYIIKSCTEQPYDCWWQSGQPSKMILMLEGIKKGDLSFVVTKLKAHQKEMKEMLEEWRKEDQERELKKERLKQELKQSLPSVEKILELGVKDLKDLCKKVGLGSGRRKKQLQEALINFKTETGEEGEK